MNPISIELQIDELLLTGFAPGDRGRIAAALSSELTRLLLEHGLPPALLHGGNFDRIDGGAFQLKSGERPETVGRQIAASVFRQWSEQ